MTQVYEFRNPRYSQPDNSVIDMEINHPVVGWAPFTAHPDDVDPIGKVMYDAAVAAGGVAPYIAPAPTNDQIDAERDRRIAAGSSFSVPGVGAVPITGTDRDQIVFTNKLLEANAKKTAGSTAADILIRDKSNSNLLLTPDQMIALVNQGTFWIQATMQVSWDMKDRAGAFTDGPPVDFTDDKYWP